MKTILLLIVGMFFFHSSVVISSTLPEIKVAPGHVSLISFKDKNGAIPLSFKPKDVPDCYEVQTINNDFSLAITPKLPECTDWELPLQAGSSNKILMIKNVKKDADIMVVFDIESN